jgi:hypothetical protein
MTIFGVPWEELRLADVEAFLAAAGGEPLISEAKGTTLRAEQMTKHVCGFANPLMRLLASWVRTDQRGLERRRLRLSGRRPAGMGEQRSS